MERSKQILTLFLAAVCLLGYLSGCAARDAAAEETAPSGSGALGRYVETVIPLPECKHVEDMVLLNDGRLRIAYRKEGGAAAVSTTAPDQKTWEDTWEIPENTLPGDYLEILSLSPDGRIFCHSVSWNEDAYHFCLIEPDGTCRELPVAVPEVDESLGFLLLDADFTASGKLIAQFQHQQVRQIHLETGEVGENLNELESRVTNMGCAGESIYMLGETTVSVHMDGETKVLDNAMGKQITASLKATESDPYRFAFWQNPEGYVFFTTHAGLFSYIPGGSITEELVSGGRSSLGDPRFSITALTGTEEDSFYILGSLNGEGPVLFRYAYDSQTPTVPDNRLNIYSLYDNDDLKTLIARYRLYNPDMEISLEVGLDGASGITEADAIRSLNTQILAGSGPDMIMLDGFNLDSYLEKGVLMDLSGILAKAEPTLPQVTKCYERDGEIFAIPTRFLLSAVYGPGHIVSQIQDLDSLVAACQQLKQEHPEAAGILGALQPEVTAEWFYDSCCYTWMEEDGTINKDKLTAYYAAMQTLYALDAPFQEKYPSQITLQNPWDVGEIYSTGMEDSAYLYQYDTLISFGTLNGMYMFSWLMAADDKLEGYETELLKLSGSGVFSPQQIMGILTTCQHPQAAEDFLLYMLSDKVQEKDRNNTFPVNQAVFEKELATETRRFDFWFRHGMDDTDANNDEEMFQPIYPDAENREKVRTWVENLTTPAPTDRTIRKTILAQIPPCLFGEITPEEAAQTALRTLNLYLAE